MVLRIVKFVELNQERVQKNIAWPTVKLKRAEYDKKYYEENKERKRDYAKEYSKKYHEENKGKKREYQKEYNRLKAFCEVCQLSLTKMHLSRHNKTQRHLVNLAKISNLIFVD